MSTEDVFVESAGEKYRLQVLRDFRKFKELVLSTNAWTKQYSDSHTLVETRPPEDKSTGINIVRVKREMPGVTCEDLYDTLHDAGYRATWDENMLEGKNIATLSPHNDIGYYAVKLPWPLKNRDFCNLRSWMEFTNGEFVIFNHSVKHPNCPEKKQFVRARSIITGYLIQPFGDGGCLLSYITCSDPCGSIPHSVINFTTTRIVPKVMNQLQKCALKYGEYFAKNGKCPREELPWRTPKMNWSSTFNYPGEEEAATSGANVGLNDTREGTVNRDGERVMSLMEESSLAAGSQYSSPACEGLTGRCVGAESATPTTAEGDSPVVQQYKDIMHRLANVADDTFIVEGRAPAVAEYTSRVGVFVDGVRRTSPH
ncbi:START domain containing protein, putative [Trypanosoma equiperdum]|uniref:START domain-containing protein 10 n=3 Tax=Trypanozoon TaxID=39700 RepID=C9ZKK9_TRYB9|nr:hypothetical protein, conserved [Trypanosoma brucei gambiense DAL972]RHW73569.1 START domain containing protein [Trypanosoma brucei equiperdum]CBH09975.1 hypothetical protein, conserved [Trypanosoma brucei gambiense DAL972]SCU72853.1 START domain containing protein, putative [Trypanosoma equiperdum]|eukprot:XP_011772266.1 hypothetical protein, conserved [Trypanosoma brucei gambiense DAL972]